jgi:hypothetical protein
MHPEQQEHLDRVSSKTSPAILRFYQLHCGEQFHADDLRNFVLKVAGVQIAPNSAYRVMYDLKKKGLLNYEVINRRQSLYRFLTIDPPNPFRRPQRDLFDADTQRKLDEQAERMPMYAHLRGS